MVRVLALAVFALLFVHAGAFGASPTEGAGPADAASSGLASAAPASSPTGTLPATGTAAVPAGTSDAADPQARKAAATSGLTLVGKNGNEAAQDFQFRLGQSATIRATGTYAEVIRAELAKSASTRVLVLHLDGVPMTHLPVDASTADGAVDGEIDVHVQLSRDPTDEENLKAWTDLLKKQDGYTVEAQLALAIGDAPAVDVRSPFPFQFQVAPPRSIGGTLAVGLSLFAILYYLLIRSRAALRSTIDGPYSLGKSQMAFWGLLVLLAFVGVWLLTDTMERIPSQVLILLGISGATGLGAVLIGANKPGEAAANVARAVASPSKPRDFFRDICSDGDGLSLHRVQVAAWTVVLGAVFVRAVSQAITMPEFAETLLVLMGISNGTYLGFKFPEKP